MTSSQALAAPAATDAWWNAYVGVPYLARGRTREGADCWGLVRLVQAEQFGHALPGFDVDYTDAADPSVDELIARHVEGWDRLPAGAEQPGDVVLLRIMGRLAHVGLLCAPARMLHARQGYSATIERLDSGAWRHRVEGYYRWSPRAVLPITPVQTPAPSLLPTLLPQAQPVPLQQAILLAACPHPLRQARMDAIVPAGMSLGQVARWVQSGVSAELAGHAVVLLDGRVVPSELLDATWPQPGQRIEYRALARGGNVGRMILSLAVMAAAWYVAPLALGFGAGSAGWAAATAAGSGLSVSLAAAGLNMAGGLLVNSIFPVRPPKLPTQPRDMFLLQGAQNQATPYGAIPVVLGRIRFTPPLAAQGYAETQARTGYLRLALCWGYGPLQISDLRIGDTPIDDYEEVEHETLTAWDDTTEDKTHFNSLYGRDVVQDAPGIKLLLADGYTTRTLSSTQTVDRITVTFNFPQGLFGLSSQGNVYSRRCSVRIQVRPTSGGAWNEVATIIPARTINLAPSWYNVDADDALESVYRWVRISLDHNNQIITRYGAFSTSSTAAPTGNLLARLQADNFGLSTTFERLPPLGAGEEDLWQICTYGDTVFSSVDVRGAMGLGSVSGCGLSFVSLKATLAAGSITRSQSETMSLYKRTRDPFAHSVTFYVPSDTYEVRCERTNDNSTTEVPSYDDCYLYTITGYSNTRPINAPKPLAMTALRIKATNQLNGSIDGITGTVQSICKDWDSGSSTWIVRATRNPASLLRYVLQHPANAQRCADARLNLPELQAWHVYCKANKFMFDSVLAQQQSLLDVLRDIAAAGRASPTQREGQWTVIIDQVRSAIAQHFTPHNSWGFEGARQLPRMPHAWRVAFSNAAKGYQPDEMIVYADGYTSANATLFEGLQLPGVTTAAAVYKHARFHLAQLSQRPETYTLNADIEHLVCTRGDLVRVTHDVPLWGLASGRIKTRTSGTVLELDEAVPMVAATQYTIRIRLMDGSSITRIVDVVGSDGYYSSVTLTSSVTVDEGAPLNLFMFGALSSESVECIVTAIEPQQNMSARLTLVDYGPAVYDSDSETLPAFDSQITLPPVLQQQTVTLRPFATGVVSDDTALTRSSTGYQANIRVGYTNPANLVAQNISHIQARWALVESDPRDWTDGPPQPVSAGALLCGPVDEGAAYAVSLRYISAAGRVGRWAVATAAHTVIGLSAPPSDVSGLNLEVVNEQALLTFDAATNIDVLNGGYLRLRHSSDAASPLWSNAVDMAASIPGSAVSATVPLLAGSYLAKWVDVAGNESDSATIVSPGNLPAILRMNVVQTLAQHPSFAGAMVGVVYDAALGGIILSSGATFDRMDGPFDSAAGLFDSAAPTSGVVQSGTYTFASGVDLGAVYSSRVTARIESVGYDAGLSFDSHPGLFDDATGYFDGTGVADVSAALYVRTSDSAPASEAWSAWRHFRVGDYSARAYQFQARLQSESAAHNIAITELSATVDMPDRIERAENVVSGAGALAVTYATPFQVTPNVAITAQDMATGDYYLVTAKSASGFTITFKNSAGANVSRTFDRLSRGY